MIDLSQGAWSTDVFRPENPVQCTLLNDGVALIEGVLQLLSVSKTGQTYECAISGGAGDLFTQMGNTKLRDVFANPANINMTIHQQMSLLRGHQTSQMELLVMGCCVFH